VFGIAPSVRLPQRISTYVRGTRLPAWLHVTVFKEFVKLGIIVFAHGSRIESANQAVRITAAALAEAGGFAHVEPAFLELGEPNLEGAVAKLAAMDVTLVIVVPYFLTLGIHLERDLPALVQAISTKFNNLKIVVTPPLDGHPGLVGILRDRVRDARH